MEPGLVEPGLMGPVLVEQGFGGIRLGTVGPGLWNQV